jgi:hypothetical protein
VSTIDEIRNALSGDAKEIRLDNDLTPDKALVVNRDVTIDLNNHKIEGVVNSVFSVSGATLTLTGDGRVTNTKVVGVARNGGTIKIEGGIYTSTTSEGFQASRGGTVIFDNGEIHSREGALTAATGGGTIEMNGGTIITEDNFGIATNGTSGRGGNTITMNGGIIRANIVTTGYEAIGVYIANSDTFVMNGGEIYANGGTGLCMRGGNVTINNGSITATAGTDGMIADDRRVMTGTSAVIYDEAANYPGNAGMSLTINGGVITGVDHSIQILSNEETPNVTVTGGTLVPSYP